MSAAIPWTCPACLQTVRTPFCAECGEEPLARHELLLRGVAEKIVHAVYAFLLLLFCLAMQVARLSAQLDGGGLDSPRVDTLLSVANLLACAAYLHAAIGTVYGTRGALRVLQAIVLALAVGAIVLGYRFALFLITLYAT